MILSLGLVIFLGVIGGFILEKIKIPKVVYYIILGLLLGPTIFALLDESLLNISSYLRQIALMIILTRSGLSLDIKKLKEIGRPAILLCFVPATFEISGITIFAPLLLDVTYFEAMLMGSVLGAVSPAIVVPRMIKIMNEKYGDKNHVPELVMAGSSVDDIYVIVLFYAFKGLVANNNFNALTLLNIPLSIILGIVLGIIVGILLYFLFKYIKIDNILKVAILFGASLLMIGIENILKEYVSISSLLGIMVVGMILAMKLKDDANKIQNSYNGMWFFFEILLFVLVGATIDLNYAFSIQGLYSILLVFIGLAFRTLGTFLSVLGTKLTIKERIFVIISYLPKATVQASIGGIALMEGLSCGTAVLTLAIISILITAPLGAVLIDNLYKKLLKKDELNELSFEKNEA